MKLTDVSKLVKKYLLFFLIGLLIIVVGGWIYVVSMPKTPKPPQNIAWKGLVPGETTKQDLLKTLGEPDPKFSSPSANVYGYKSEKGGPPNEVTVKNGVVDLIKERVLEGNLSSYIEKYGEPEGEFFETNRSSFKLYVFTKQGIAVSAHKADGGVFEVWYFPPVTLEEFLNKWGKGLTTKETEGNF